MGVMRRRVLVRVFLGFLATVTVLALIAAMLGIWTVRHSFPDTSGEVALPGLDTSATVLRDEYGVAHIYADNAHDLFMTQGFTHAQDRFWEMDFRRHVTGGRLAELFGPEQAETDVYLRTMGWRDIAEQEYELLDDESQAYLDSYAAGVNAWLEEHDGAAASLEYALLGALNDDHTIEPWEPADSLAWLKAMAWDLSGNLQEETQRAQMLALGLEEEQIDELFPAYPFDEHLPTTDTEEHAPADTAADLRVSPDEQGHPDQGQEAAHGQPTEAQSPVPDLPQEAVPALNRVAEGATGLPSLLGPDNGADLGSNAWAVSGEHTESDEPLLANDPHLGQSMPSIWYQNGLHCTEVSDACPFDVSGFGFAGLPGVVIGQNDAIAWGFTNLYPDVMDLFLEELDGDDHYVVDGEERPLETREETVVVEGGEDIEFTVRSTHRGPILSDADAGAHLQGIGDTDGDYAVSLQWTALSPGNTADAIFSLNRADDWDDFRDAASHFDVPSQNLLYADDEGNIGYQAPGTIPVRGEGDGRYPAPGWDSAYDWQDPIPFDELPSVLNPESGVIVTGNQAAVDDEYEHRLTDDWNYGYRSQRINDLLDGAMDEGPVGVEDMERIHMDSFHASAAEITPYLVDVDVEGTTAEAQDLLRDWDLHTEPDSAGAAFYQATWRHLLPLLFDEIAPLHMPGDSRSMYVVRQLLEEPNSPWWDSAPVRDRFEEFEEFSDLEEVDEELNGEDAAEERAEQLEEIDERDRVLAQISGRDEVLAAAMDAAVEELSDLLGDDPADWRWGDLHTLTATHESFGTSGIGPVEALFNRGPVESSGGSDIVNATGWNPSEGFGITTVPSMRMVVDMSDRDSSTWIHLTGNSGHAFHSNYADQLPLWSEGETLPFAVSEEAIQEAATDELTLLPEAPAD